METFKIRTYGRTELALLYCPLLTDQAAYRKLMYWIDLNPGLRQGVDALGTSPNCRSFNPQQVKLIVDALGEP